MKPIALRPVEPERDFRQIADWFSALEDDPVTESALREDYETHLEQVVRFRVAEETGQGKLLGFCWAYRNISVEGMASFCLFVSPERRKQGAGRRLYDDMLQAVEDAHAKALRVKVRDTDPESRAFTERRGFVEVQHAILRSLDLTAFDDRAYDEIITKLQGEGFLFTSMEELGNTEEAQRKLYLLNETTGMETIGTDGKPSWASFGDFQQSVCQTDWYRPGGQMVAIDTTTGNWAAMSAITLSGENGFAYNLHTGVDKRYRGRKLAQAVKVLALRYARDVLKAACVCTHQNAKNLPMIAINRKMGYVEAPGTFLMEKKFA